MSLPGDALAQPEGKGVSAEGKIASHHGKCAFIPEIEHRFFALFALDAKLVVESYPAYDAAITARVVELLVERPGLQGVEPLGEIGCPNGEVIRAARLSEADVPIVAQIEPQA